MPFFFRSTPPRSQIPGPKGRLFIGDAIAFDEAPIPWMLRTKSQYGDIVRLDSETIVVHNPKDIHRVLGGTNTTYLLDNATLAGKKGRKILLDGQAQWMESRKYLGKSLNHIILNEHISRANTNLNKKSASLVEIKSDLFDVSQRMLGYAIADFCIGADENFDTIFAAVESVFWASLKVTDSEESRLSWSPRPIAKRAKELNKNLVKLLEQVVIKRKLQMSECERQRDALDSLVHSLGDAPVEQLVAAVRLMMVTAHGPSGAVFSWCLLRLAERPDLVEKIRQEIQQNESAVLLPNQFPVTHSVIKETMRLHPPNWLMGRTVHSATQLDKYHLPANCRVLFSPYVVHRDSRFWQNPEDFIPERWLQKSTPHTDGAFFPFGGGPRICPGALLGPIQLIIGLKAILSRYDLQLPPLSTVEHSHSTLYRPKNVTVSWTTTAGMSALC